MALMVTMKVYMLLKIKDVPGALLKALEPVSNYGGNIISVTHSRAEKDMVSVSLTFEIRDKSSLDRIKDRLEEAKISIASLDVEGRTYYLKTSFYFIFIGHVIDRDVQDTIDRINKIGLVSLIDVVMPSPEKKSTVLFYVEVDEARAGELLATVDDICRKKDFLLIRSLS